MTIAVQPEPKLEHPSERLDRDLSVAVEGALWAYDPIRIGGDMIGVEADEDGTVTLTGIVPTRTIAEIAGHITSGVAGVTGVVNHLATDTEVQSAVAIAIAVDPQVGASTDLITITSILGQVYIGGMVFVRDMDAAQAAVDRAGELAAGVPGVREVINQIDAVELTTEASTTTPTAGAPTAGEAASGPTPEELARAERLAVWRERAAATD